MPDAPRPDDGFLLELALIAVLILLNGFFAAAEIAVVTVSRGRLKALADQGSRGAARVLRLREDPDRFLATVQVGITLVGTLASAVGGVAAIERLEPWLAAGPVPWARTVAEPVAVVVVVVAIAYLSLIVGELVPKSLALRHAEGLALLVAPVVDGLRVVAGPVVGFLTASSRLVLRLLGSGGARVVAPHHTRDDLRAIVEEAEEQGVVSGELVAGAIEFHEREVREVLTPRPRIRVLRRAAGPEELAATLRESGHTRYPVVEKDLDDLLGYVYGRDVFAALLRGGPVDLAPLLRQPLLVPGTKPATELLQEMRRNREQLAMVVSEHGSVEGLVTLEDLVEVIVGEIPDEAEDVQAEPRVRVISEDRLECDGSVPIHEIQAEHGLDLPESPDYVTVAGLLLDRLGRMAVPGDQVEVGPHRITALRLSGNRVERVRVEVVPAEDRARPGR